MPSAQEILEQLRTVDTPTVCNALEVVEGRRTSEGFTRTPVVPLDPRLPPVVGYVVTARIEAERPASADPAEVAATRRDYYRMVSEAVGHGPTVVAIEDTDDPPGVGAFWGEVNVAVHLGLGVQGAITNGSMRDLGEVDPGFQILAGSVGPSHAFVRVTATGGPVTVHGLSIRPGDLVHADRHGAVLIGPDQLEALPAAITTVVDNERPVLDAARRPGFDLEALFDAWGLRDDGH